MMILGAIRSIFPLFAKKIEVLRIGEPKTDSSTAGIFPPDESPDYSEPVSIIYEPLLPEPKAQSILMAPGGSTTQYDYEWWSIGKYPKGTLVSCDGLQLVVETSEPYWDEGGFCVYYLNNRGDSSDFKADL